MARRSLASTSATLIIVVLATGAVIEGAAFARLALAAQGRNQVEPEIAQGYSDVWGLRGAARRLLARVDSPQTISSDAIAKVLVVQPTDGLYWLALAEAMQAKGGSSKRIRDSLQTSEAMTPREARIMARRAAFIIRQWDESPDAERGLAIANLVDLGDRLPAGDRDRIREVFAAKSDDARTAIRDALLAKTRGDRSLLPQLGL